MKAIGDQINMYIIIKQIVIMNTMIISEITQ